MFVLKDPIKTLVVGLTAGTALQLILQISKPSRALSLFVYIWLHPPLGTRI